jgi:Tfp pilus assembly protein PilF
VQVGFQAMADRYTYLPALGIQIALLWTLREILLLPNVRRIAVVAAVLILGGCAALTWNQIQFWKNSQTLYERALAVTHNNYLAESNLGTTLFNEGNFAGAELHFKRAVKWRPNFATAHFKLAATLDELNRPDDALNAYESYLSLRPHDALANYNAGVLLLNKNQPVPAAAHFQTATECKDSYAAAFIGLALAKIKLNDKGDAITALQQALKLDPNFPGATETLARLQRK